MARNREPIEAVAAALVTRGGRLSAGEMGELMRAPRRRRARAG